MGSSGEEFPLYSEVANSLCCTFFLIDIGCLNELYHYIFVSYLVD